MPHAAGTYAMATKKVERRKGRKSQGWKKRGLPPGHFAIAAVCCLKKGGSERVMDQTLTLPLKWVNSLFAAGTILTREGNKEQIQRTHMDWIRFQMWWVAVKTLGLELKSLVMGY